MTTPEPITPQTVPADVTDTDLPTLDDVGTTDTSPETDDPADLVHARKLRSENRNLRDRAKTAETELETANKRLNAMHRREVERIAAASLKDATDLWTVGHEVTEFLGEDGELDPERVTAVAKELTTERPHWAADPEPKRPPSERPVESLRAGATPANYAPPNHRWADALRPS